MNEAVKCDLLPTTRIGPLEVTRLICGGNPFSGFSHVSEELDWEMLRYYTMPRLQETLDECWRNGINTVVSRGDRHQMRTYLEHRERGGKLQWIVQTAPELADLRANIAQIARFGAAAIYNQGSYTDNLWHKGRVDEALDLVKFIHDQGLAAGVGSHIPQVIEYVEEKAWEADFYVCSFYNLARGYKSAPAVDRDAYAKDRFPPGDPDLMTAVMRKASKPCLGIKVLAASRKCSTPEEVKATFKYAFGSTKPNDAIIVGVFQKYRNQVAEDAAFVREILARTAAAR